MHNILISNKEKYIQIGGIITKWKLVLSHIFCIILIGTAYCSNVDETGLGTPMGNETLNYENQNMGFTIQYPKLWMVKESPMDVSFVGPKDSNGFYQIVAVALDSLPMEISSEEYARISIENMNLLYPCHIISEYNMDINGMDAYVIVAKSEANVLNLTNSTWVNKQIYITDNLTGYVIIGPPEESLLSDDYFESMFKSFKVIPKSLGIEVENLMITPHITEPGQTVTIKFNAINKASVEKTKVIDCICMIFEEGGMTDADAIDSKEITLAPGETEHIEFVYKPRETGNHLIWIGNQWIQIDVKNKNPIFSLSKALFAIALLVMYILKKKE